MKKKILGLLGVGLLAGSSVANAALIDVVFSVAPGNWATTGTPFGIDLNSTLTGTMVVDSSKANGSFAQEDALVSFSMTTGSRTWTRSDYNSISASTAEFSFDSNGSLIGFTLIEFTDIDNSMVIRSDVFSNLFTLTDDPGVFGSPSRSNSCAGCVSFSLRTSSVPEPGTLALLGLGLAGLGLSRRRKAN